MLHPEDDSWPYKERSLVTLMPILSNTITVKQPRIQRADRADVSAIIDDGCGIIKKLTSIYIPRALP